MKTSQDCSQLCLSIVSYIQRKKSILYNFGILPNYQMDLSTSGSDDTSKSYQNDNGYFSKPREYYAVMSCQKNWSNYYSEPSRSEFEPSESYGSWNDSEIFRVGVVRSDEVFNENPPPPERPYKEKKTKKKKGKRKNRRLCPSGHRYESCFGHREQSYTITADNNAPLKEKNISKTKFHDRENKIPSRKTPYPYLLNKPIIERKRYLSFPNVTNLLKYQQYPGSKHYQTPVTNYQEEYSQKNKSKPLADSNSDKRGCCVPVFTTPGSYVADTILPHPQQHQRVQETRGKIRYCPPQSQTVPNTINSNPPQCGRDLERTHYFRPPKQKFPNTNTTGSCQPRCKTAATSTSEDWTKCNSQGPSCNRKCQCCCGCCCQPHPESCRDKYCSCMKKAVCVPDIVTYLEEGIEEIYETEKITETSTRSTKESNKESIKEAHSKKSESKKEDHSEKSESKKEEEIKVVKKNIKKEKNKKNKRAKEKKEQKNSKQINENKGSHENPSDQKKETEQVLSQYLMRIVDKDGVERETIFENAIPTITDRNNESVVFRNIREVAPKIIEDQIVIKKKRAPFPRLEDSYPENDYLLLKDKKYQLVGTSGFNKIGINETLSKSSFGTKCDMKKVKNKQSSVISTIFKHLEYRFMRKVGTSATAKNTGSIKEKDPLKKLLYKTHKTALLLNAAPERQGNMLEYTKEILNLNEMRNGSKGKQHRTLPSNGTVNQTENTGESFFSAKMYQMEPPNENNESSTHFEDTTS